MSAPAGNEFWKKRTKHGRDKLFSDPKKLWEAACNYFQSVVDDPFVKKDFKGRDNEMVKYELPKPFTMAGLCFYLHVNKDYFNQFKKALTKSKKDQGFSSVISDIENVMYSQKFSGAAAGIFNANIIARDLGLADKKEVDVSGGMSIKSMDDFLK